MYVCMYVCNKNPLFTSINSIPEKKHKTFSKELRKKKKLLQHVTMHLSLGHVTTEVPPTEIKMKKA